MLLFYLITILYGSNSLPLPLLDKVEKNIDKVEKNIKLQKNSALQYNVNKTNHKGILSEIHSNPQQFISEVQNLDPAALKHIFSLLEELLETSEARENELVTDLDNKNSALSDANDNVVNALDALDAANQAQSDAETAATEAQGVLSGKQAEAAAAAEDLATKKEIHKAKQTDKNDAQTLYDDEVSGLNDEQTVITDVLDIIQGLQNKQRKKPTTGWHIIFRQTLPFALSVDQWLSYKPDSPDNPNFSILGQLEDYRNSDGKFEFKLGWPGTTDQVQHWKQTSNPADLSLSMHSGVEGYEAIHIPFSHNGWGGLERGGGHAVSDGSIGPHQRWYYAVGATHGGCIPAWNSCVNDVELWAYVA